MTDRTSVFPLTGPINLLTRIGHGSVTVTARDECTKAVVQLTPRDPSSDILDRMVVELQGPTLTVTGPRQGGLSDVFIVNRKNRDAVDVEITVPTGTASKIVTASADVVVKGTIGGADLATGSADVQVDTVDGDLRLRVGSADSQVGHVTGDATVRTGSGDVRLGEVGGTLQSGSGSGNLEVGSALGPVRSRAGSGNARIDAVHGDVDIAAGSGNITLGLPQGVSVRLDVTSGSGRVHSDLPIEDAPTQPQGAISVRTRTGSGDVRLFRAA